MRAAVASIVTLLLVLALVAGIVLWLLTHGFSASEKPSALEAFLARHARTIATPSEAKTLRSPLAPTEEDLAAGREHWAGHCAACHALDGSGNTDIGRNLYPPAPDMRDALTQDLTDGELFYIINNGVRFTGMPAWGSLHSATDNWQLVAFIRRLPHLTPEELQQMQQQPAGEEHGAPGHHHAPGTPPHTD